MYNICLLFLLCYVSRGKAIIGIDLWAIKTPEFMVFTGVWKQPVMQDIVR